MASLNPDILLAAYANGAFPMGESRDSNKVNWYTATERGIIPLANAHVPRRLQKTLLNNPYTITTNHNFVGVMQGCAEVRTIGVDEDAGGDTWINTPIIAAYTDLHKRGHAHSLEVWDGESLIGGIYGVSLGRAFFGESMFSRKRDASKIALVHLIARLHYHGFMLFDAQFLTDHLAQFGAVAIPADDYSALLAGALAAGTAGFSSADEPSSTGLLTLYLQSTTQTS